MDLLKMLCIIILLSLTACTNNANSQNRSTENNIDVKNSINTSGNTITLRFYPPGSATRKVLPELSFGNYLRNLPLKENGALVKFYSGDTKPNNGVYHAVVDLPIGDKNLHQCADAVMRLRAEYLWKNKQYDDIHFNFTNGFQVDYSEWKKGRRMVVNGNKTYWNNRNNPSNSAADFWNYMELIFTYAGTASLEKELISVESTDMQIGDVFIIGGYPGHAVIVVDMCENKDKNETYFMLAQSYMPAQEIQVLQNPNNLEISPWYTLRKNGAFETPEWNFDYTQLKRFK